MIIITLLPAIWALLLGEKTILAYTAALIAYIFLFVFQGNSNAAAGTPVAKELFLSFAYAFALAGNGFFVSILLHLLGRSINNYQSLLDSERIKTAKQADLALTDALTKLPNRRNFDAQISALNREVQMESWAVLLIDFDHFKSVNDTYGHNVGDLALCKTAERLQSVIGRHDSVYRIGGDEFAAIALGTGPNEAERFARRLLGAACQPLVVNETAIPISISIGIATFPDHGDSATNLIQKADEALLAAKRLGRGRYETYGTIERPMMDRLSRRLAG